MHAPPPFLAEDSKAFSMDEVGLGSNDFPDPSLYAVPFLNKGADF
jgi:hypothetical protein